MTYDHPNFRTPAEQAGWEAVTADLASRVRYRVGDVPENERGEWRQNLLSRDDRWSSIRESEAYMAFREPFDPEAAVIADAMVRAGSVSEDLYARLLTVADRRYAAFRHGVGQPVTRAVAFDAFGTLVHIGRKRHPFERLIRQARDRAEALPSPMVQPIGLADYSKALELPHPDAELAMLEEELATIALYPDTLDTLRRVRDQGVTVAVASNLAMPYAAPLKALLGDLVDVWHFSFDAGAIKPERGFYAGLTAKLGCAPGELLMVGDTWRDDIVGAVDAGSRAQWINRDGRPAFARRFIAVRGLSDVGWNLWATKSEIELVTEGIDANLAHLHNQRWANEMGRLRGIVESASEADKAAAEQALNDHFDTRDQVEASRVFLVKSASDTVAARALKRSTDHSD